MDEDDAGGLPPLKPLSRTKRRLVHPALEIEAEEPSGVAYQVGTHGGGMDSR